MTSAVRVAQNKRLQSYLGMFTCAKIPIPRDFYAKECLKKIVNRGKANYDLGVGPDEK